MLIIKNRKILFALATVFVPIIFLSQCINTAPRTDPRGTAYAEEHTCRQCHQAIYDSALLTAHFNASAAATLQNVPGHFNTGHNSFIYDSITRVQIEKRESGYYQVLYKNDIAQESGRFDIGFGFRHAQTWLYWNNDQTYELPVSYYRAVNNWGTSPGFSATIPNFNRLIGVDCFECHSSYISTKKKAAGDYFSKAGEPELLEKSSLVYGIDCQRCHGPAAQHADYHVQHPDIKVAKYIVSKQSLNQQQKLDACAVCHSGNDKRKLRSRFFFRPGELLADYFLPSLSPDSSRAFDVHGNQFNLLKQSKCFLGSNSMTCASCHNPHNRSTNGAPGAENMAAYSQKCMGCHTEAAGNFCTVDVAPGLLLQDNCIDCHMPKQSSNAISFQLSGSTDLSAYLLRTHRIAIYNNLTRRKNESKDH
ncbi:MAG: hypothetical protein WAU23_06900 [Ferruginibacter sp.]